jgi:competence protein ComEC
MKKYSRKFILRTLPLLTALLCAGAFFGCSPSAESPAAVSAPPGQMILSDDLPAADDYAVFFCNVGKADAAILRFGETAVLIDTGSKASAPQLIAGLNLLGIEKIEAVFLTHSHSDHIGGLAALAANYHIPMVYSPLYSEQTKNGEGKIIKRCDKLDLPHSELSAGDAVAVADGVAFDVLGPLEFNEDDDNDNSLVLRFTAGQTTFLFTGDMQFAEEDTLLEADADLSAGVLKVGNHGNPDATGESFARAVSPYVAVISTDTAVDTNSANARVLAALAPAQIYLTQDYTLGVLLTPDGGGNVFISNPERPVRNIDASILSADTGEQTIVIGGAGETLDLSGCVLYCDRSDATLRFPGGTRLNAGGTLAVTGAGGGGDLEFSSEDKPLSKKKANTVTLYDPYGVIISSIER